MAKKSSINKNNRRLEMAKRYAEHRRELRLQVVNAKLSDEERYQAQVKLQKLPRDSSRCRVINRCAITGRPRGVLRQFMLSRIAFREMALKGLLPGVTKASW